MHTAKWERASVSGGCFDGNGKTLAKGIVRGSWNWEIISRGVTFAERLFLVFYLYLFYAHLHTHTHTRARSLARTRIHAYTHTPRHATHAHAHTQTHAHIDRCDSGFFIIFSSLFSFQSMHHWKNWKNTANLQEIGKYCNFC